MNFDKKMGVKGKRTTTTFDAIKNLTLNGGEIGDKRLYGTNSYL